VIAFILLCLPVFAVILLGWYAVRRGLLGDGALVALSAFSFLFALPCMLFRLVAAQPLSAVFDARFFLGYLGADLLILAGTIVASLWIARRPLAAAAAHGVTAAMGNVGYLGPPLLFAIYGERAAGPVAMAIMAEVMLVLTLGAALMAGRQAGSAMVRWRGLLLNPIVVSILGGAAFAATGFALPGPVERFLSFLGGAAAPTALFALGGVLGTLRISAPLVVTAASLSFAKLLAYPALVWLILGPLLGLPGLWVASGVLLAALPTATNAFVLAQRYNTEPKQVSATILLSTLLAALSFPITAWLLDAAP
jgi:hypothetical protein